ncbi:MAG: carbon-nitrogen hydrolase family protein [Candidatus Thermoplasmatota archaeon]|nr:carbon-nitrogen hydrolase family protein [Candidatus Thermoplasmatota archaeon]
MNVSIVSMEPRIADKTYNISTMESYIKKSSSDLIVFGELTLTGYHCKDELRSLAEPVDGPSIKTLKAITEKTKKHIIFGMPLRDEMITGLIHNAAVLIQPNGKVHIYKKWFLPTFGPFEEKIFFDEGQTLPVFKTDIGTIGLCICYDIYFPELTKAFSLQGADIIVCISASPSVTRTYFETILPARAIENTTFVIYSNIVGNQENLVFWGGSQAYDPLGNQLVKAPYFKESLISFDLDLSTISLIRAQRPVLRDIRPEIYHDLYQISRQKKLERTDLIDKTKESL